MKKFVVVLGVMLTAGAALAQTGGVLDWSYPNAPAVPDPEPNKLYTAAGAPASMKLTLAQINDPFNPPDWFPAEHGPVPKIVSKGRAPEVRACMQCHLVHGQGKPESSSIAGQSAKYIIDQTHAFRDGDRNNSRSANMVAVAKAITDAELAEAAAYFAALKPPAKRWVRVVEADRAPASTVVNGGGRFLDRDRDADRDRDRGRGRGRGEEAERERTVPIPPTQIFEIAESDEVKLRNPRVGFVAYVPRGSIAKGRLVSSGNMGKVAACTSCHGAGLKGQGDTPGLAGMSPTYMVRQLSDMKIGARKGKALGLMKSIIPKLSDEDMVNVSAYAASLRP